MRRKRVVITKEDIAKIKELQEQMKQAPKKPSLAQLIGRPTARQLKRLRKEQKNGNNDLRQAV